MSDANQAVIPEWLRKKMLGTLTSEEYGQGLDRKVAAGEISVEEAEDEYQWFTHRDMDSFLGVYGC